jgi:hypothetical protein
MTMLLTTPITGGAQTGFTAPTYILTDDIAPSANGRQKAITSLGGTQTNVEAHSVSKPFTVTVFRPQQLKTLPGPNPVTGVIKSIPTNTYKVVVRKVMVPYVNQAAQIGSVNVSVNVPAGCDTYEPEDVRAMISCAIGALNQLSAGIGDTAVSGVI